MGGTEFILILSWFLLQRKSKIKTIEKRHMKRRCWRKMGKHREDGNSWSLLISLFSINTVPSKHPLTISFPWQNPFPLYSFLSLCHLKALLNSFYLSLSNVSLSLSCHYKVSLPEWKINLEQALRKPRELTNEVGWDSWAKAA